MDSPVTPVEITLILTFVERNCQGVLLRKSQEKIHHFQHRKVYEQLHCDTFPENYR